jgi:hypothetical protein
MTERTARKRHRCDHAKWRQRVGLPPVCSGWIEPGERYAECPEHGEPFHPARYHPNCLATEEAMSKESPPC